MRIALGQTGAPTAVVDATVRAVLDAADQHDVLAVRGGPDGLVSGALAKVPPGGGPKHGARGGSWLGGGRRALTSEDLDRIVEHLDRAGVDVLLLIGGNGTMALLHALAARAQEKGSALQVVGIPKTIDNDLLGIDHAPGYPSAARYLANVVPDLSRDHEAMKSVEPVRLIETLGRSTGWLALAATWHRDAPEHAPDLVLLPEDAFEQDAFLADVEEAVSSRGRAFVVVSEGVDLGDASEPFNANNHSQLLHGGVSRRLAAIVTDHLRLPARGEVLGMVQRCASAFASDLDVQEAGLLGGHAVQLALDGRSGVMATLTRVPADASTSRCSSVPLAEVAGLNRPVPQNWRGSNPRSLAGFDDWLSPLVR